MPSKKGFLRLNLTTKRAMMGYLFVMPFIIGILVFFLYPALRSIRFSFTKLDLVTGGYTLTPVGWQNYYQAFNQDPNFRRQLVESAMSMAADVPLIVIFSFFAANLINQNFRGRAAARAIFFLPVILSSGIMIQVTSGDLLQSVRELGASSAGQSGAFGSFQFASDSIRTLLLSSRLHPQFVGYVLGAIDRIQELVSASGVQILVFLAGLQSISPSLYEASTMEGATGWENFWKITFPMISPLILVNVIYSIIDSFTNSNNAVISKIRHTVVIANNHGYGSALAWIYFLTIFIVLGIVVWLISKAVFYQE